jgi:hypothetical protein
MNSEYFEDARKVFMNEISLRKGKLVDVASRHLVPPLLYSCDIVACYAE